jgi:hypothetical protein
MHLAPDSRSKKYKTGPIDGKSVTVARIDMEAENEVESAYTVRAFERCVRTGRTGRQVLPESAGIT